MPSDGDASPPEALHSLWRGRIDRGGVAMTPDGDASTPETSHSRRRRCDVPGRRCIAAGEVPMSPGDVALPLEVTH